MSAVETYIENKLEEKIIKYVDMIKESGISINSNLNLDINVPESIKKAYDTVEEMGGILKNELDFEKEGSPEITFKKGHFGQQVCFRLERSDGLVACLRHGFFGNEFEFWNSDTASIHVYFPKEKFDAKKLEQFSRKGRVFGSATNAPSLIYELSEKGIDNIKSDLEKVKIVK